MLAGSNKTPLPPKAGTSVWINNRPKTVRIAVTIIVRASILPKVSCALVLLSEPKALEIILDPPIPIAIPKAPTKKEIGNTTPTAANASELIQFPTKKLSTKMFKDITSIPIEAGTACLISSFVIGCLPNSSDLLEFNGFMSGKGMRSKIKKVS